MTPQGSRHAAVCGQVADVLRNAFGDECSVRVQSPVALDDVSEPEPDVAVVRGSQFDYVNEHPREVLLLVEVSESSLSHDRGRKLAAYARNEIPDYWLIDLTAEKIEVYGDPFETGYTSKAILGHGDTVSPLHPPDSAIPVADLLP